MQLKTRLPCLSCLLNANKFFFFLQSFGTFIFFPNFWFHFTLTFPCYSSFCIFFFLSHFVPVFFSSSYFCCCNLFLCLFFCVSVAFSRSSILPSLILSFLVHPHVGNIDDLRTSLLLFHFRSSCSLFLLFSSSSRWNGFLSFIFLFSFFLFLHFFFFYIHQFTPSFLVILTSQIATLPSILTFIIPCSSILFTSTTANTHPLIR